MLVVSHCRGSGLWVRLTGWVLCCWVWPQAAVRGSARAALRSGIAKLTRGGWQEASAATHVGIFRRLPRHISWLPPKWMTKEEDERGREKGGG